MNHNLIPNPEFIESMPLPDRKAWAEALLSGDYKQGKSVLAHAGRHCCLGVYCKMKGILIPRNTGTPDGTDLPLNDPIFNNNESHGNPDIARASDMKKDTYAASELNDEKGLTFAEIAALIYPEGVNQ